jgi:hypothetical protein
MSNFSLFFCILKVMAALSANSKSLDCDGNWHPFLKKRIFWSRSNFVHFSLLHGTLEYLHDLQAKKAAPMVS